jgi:hypothetical protein
MGKLGSLQVVTAGGTVSHGGLRYDDNARLLVDGVGAIAGHVQGGLPVTAAGALAILDAGVVANFNAGVPIGTTGRVCTVAAVAPVVLFAFANAFSIAFDTFAAG